MLENAPSHGQVPDQSSSDLGSLDASQNLRELAGASLAADPTKDPHSQRDYLKFQSFELQVVSPCCRLLHVMDPGASLHLAGSYVNNPSALRRASDLDMLLFSSALKSPGSYIAFLEGLRSLADDFQRSTGISPVFFTQAATETAFSFVSRTFSGKPAEETVPCHLLFYRDGAEMMGREPPGLATKLLRDAKPVAGAKPILPEPHEQARDLDALVCWDIERAVAELVLNQDRLPRDFIVPHYVDRLILSMRIFAAHDLSFEDVSVVTLINSLDAGGSRNLAAQFQEAFAVRQGALEPSLARIEALVEPALTILEILAERAASKKP